LIGSSPHIVSPSPTNAALLGGHNFATGASSNGGVNVSVSGHIIGTGRVTAAPALHHRTNNHHHHNHNNVSVPPTSPLLSHQSIGNGGGGGSCAVLPEGIHTRDHQLTTDNANILIYDIIRW
jgi:hypothetical protein